MLLFGGLIILLKTYQTQIVVVGLYGINKTEKMTLQIVN